MEGVAAVAVVLLETVISTFELVWNRIILVGEVWVKYCLR